MHTDANRSPRHESNGSGGNKPPILVTGAHRTGTTWVGKMLTASGQAAYISEPLNRWHRVGVMAAPVQHWYTYICQENERLYLGALQKTLRLHYHLWSEVKTLRSRKDLLRMGRDWFIFARGRLKKQRPLLKDPFAVFSIPWFLSRLGCQVVVTVRHPAAFASSLKRLDWSFDFRDLLEQKLLMRDLLEPFRGEMEELAAQAASPQTPQDIIAQSSLLWRLVYGAVDRFRQQAHPCGQLPAIDIQIVRHEDLSQDPIQGFHSLYDSLGLNFSSRVENAIRKSSSSENPAELSIRSKHATRLDSRANLENWKRRLTPQEINRIRSLTEDIAAIYYPDFAWE